MPRSWHRAPTSAKQRSIPHHTNRPIRRERSPHTPPEQRCLALLALLLQSPLGTPRVWLGVYAWRSTSPRPNAPSRTARRGARGTEAGNFQGGQERTPAWAPQDPKQKRGQIARSLTEQPAAWCDQRQEPAASLQGPELEIPGRFGNCQFSGLGSRPMKAGGFGFQSL